MKKYIIEKIYLAKQMSQERAEQTLGKRILNFHGTYGYLVTDPVDNSVEWLPQIEFPAKPFDTDYDKAEYYMRKLQDAAEFLKSKTRKMEQKDRAVAYRSIKRIEKSVEDIINFINNKSL